MASPLVGGLRKYFSTEGKVLGSRVNLLNQKSTKHKPFIPVEPDSPEVRKTRRAKAKAAYAAVRTFAEDGASAALDVQA